MNLAFIFFEASNSLPPMFFFAKLVSSVAVENEQNEPWGDSFLGTASQLIHSSHSNWVIFIEGSVFKSTDFNATIRIIVVECGIAVATFEFRRTHKMG